MPDTGFSGGPPPITIEATARREPDRESVQNGGESLGAWLRDELRWGIGHFARVVCSVAVARGLSQLWSSGLVSRRAFDQATDLWKHGKAERGYSRPSGYTTYGGFSPQPERPPDPRAAGGFANASEAPKKPVHIATVEEYDLYDHKTILVPDAQIWPCPLLYRTRCDGDGGRGLPCWFFVKDQRDTPHCVAREKLQMIQTDDDDGTSFQDMREWIRKH